MRWADIDSLNHVNNVVYLAYAAESRALLADDGVIDGDRPVRTMSVEFIRPVAFSAEPVRIVSIHDGDALTQEISAGGEPSIGVAARLVTTFGDQDAIRSKYPAAEPFACWIRRGDLNATGTVSAVKTFELFQEARIRYVGHRLRRMSAGQYVVASLTVTFGAPIVWRPTPYEVRSHVTRVGGSSMTVESELSSEGTVHANVVAVMVGFDASTQRSRKFTAEERALLAPLSPAC